MATKPLPSWLMIGLTAITSFVVLFGVNLVTEPIILNRQNAQYLSLLNLDSLGNLTVGETEFATGELFNAGIEEVKTFSENNQLIAVTYQVSVTGYNPNIQFGVGIRQGVIQKIRVDGHGESAGYGADVMDAFPEVMSGIAIASESEWTSALLAESTGVTFTRVALLNAFKAIRVDYAERMNP